MKHHINSFYDTKLPEATNEAYYRAERREGVLFRTHYRLVACAGAARGGRGGSGEGGTGREGGREGTKEEGEGSVWEGREGRGESQGRK